MSIKLIQEITADEENFRTETFAPGMAMVKRDPVEPVPVGTYVAMVFRVTGYDADCDGSLMARVERVDNDGEPTGWTAESLGLYRDSTVVLDGPGDLHEMATGEATRRT